MPRKKQLPLTTLPPISEEEFQGQVVQLAKLRLWTVYHTFDSRHSEEGFPDLVFRRGPGYPIRLIVAELKKEGEEPTPEQLAWLGAFQASGIATYCWKPSDWALIQKVLS